MATEIILDVFAPPLALRDPRALRTLSAIEQVWAIHLVCEIGDDGSRIRHDTDRAEYLASAARGRLPFLATPDDEDSATLGGLVEPGLLAPGGVAELHVLGTLPWRPTSIVMRGLELVTDALAASWAMVTPEAAHGVIVGQVIERSSDDVPPVGLPRLDLAEHLAADVPRRLGWISYWSDRAAANIRFDGNIEGFAAVTRVATGWIVQLTDEPLDLDRANHLAALAAAYERYPAIGRAPRRS